MFNWSDVVSIGVLISMIVSLVWGISKIQNTTDLLSHAIDTLSKAIDKLDKAIEKVEAKIGDHGERIAVLENH